MWWNISRADEIKVLSPYPSHREEDLAELTALSHPHWLDYNELVSAIQIDPELKVIMDDLQRNSTNHPSYSLIQQLLFFKGRLVIPTQSKWVPQILG